MDQILHRYSSAVKSVTYYTLHKEVADDFIDVFSVSQKILLFWDLRKKGPLLLLNMSERDTF